MRYGPPFRYASRPGGGRVAYQVVGDGALDLVFLFGCHVGGRLALLLAATHPDQVSAVVTFGSHPATLRDEDYPWGSTVEEHEGVLATIRASSTPEDAIRLLDLATPREVADPCVRRWWRTFYLSAATPAETYGAIRSLGSVQTRGLLGSVQTPVLVLHRTGDQAARIEASRYMAERIPGARLVELPGDDHFPFFGGQDRVVATVLFTDIVDSTRLAAELGDRRWHHRLVEHQEVVRQQLARHRGREVKTTGDGFLATFDGPARAIRAADATGEIVCSRTVKDLVAGSGFAFAARGTCSLKGVPDSWQIYAVELAER